jgi:hypothetical protein
LPVPLLLVQPAAQNTPAGHIPVPLLLVQPASQKTPAGQVVPEHVAEDVAPAAVCSTIRRDTCPSRCCSCSRPRRRRLRGKSSQGTLPRTLRLQLCNTTQRDIFPSRCCYGIHPHRRRPRGKHTSHELHYYRCSTSRVCTIASLSRTHFCIDNRDTRSHRSICCNNGYTPKVWSSW